MNGYVNYAKSQLRNEVIGSGLTLFGAMPSFDWMKSYNSYLGIVLMFHHICPHQHNRLPLNKGMEITPETFDFVLGHLKASDYDIVSMDDLPERIADPSSKRRFVALTFDDGYKDNMIYALPILQRHNVPFTIYVAGDFASGEGCLWWRVIELAVLALTEVEIYTGQGILRRNTTSFRDKVRVAQDIYWIMRSCSEPLRRTQCTMLARQAGLDIAALTRNLCMDWKEITCCAHMKGCTIGAHTLSHPVLAAMDDQRAQNEIVGSRDLIQRRLGLEVHHFSYPYGDRQSCGSREYALAAEAGFKTAVTTRKGVLLRDHQAQFTALPRIPINGHWQNRSMIKGLLSAAPLLSHQQ